MSKFKWTPRKRRAAEFNREVGRILARENRLRMETRLACELNRRGRI